MEISQDLMAFDSSRGVGAIPIMPHKTKKVDITTYSVHLKFGLLASCVPKNSPFKRAIEPKFVLD